MAKVKSKKYKEWPIELSCVERLLKGWDFVKQEDNSYLLDYTKDERFAYGYKDVTLKNPPRAIVVLGPKQRVIYKIRGRAVAQVMYNVFADAEEIQALIRAKGIEVCDG